MRKCRTLKVKNGGINIGIHGSGGVLIIGMVGTLCVSVPIMDSIWPLIQPKWCAVFLRWMLMALTIIMLAVRPMVIAIWIGIGAWDIGMRHEEIKYEEYD